MSYAVLPPFFISLKVRKLFDDEVVNPGQGQPLVPALLDGHGDESHVGVRRLLRLLGVLRTFGLRWG